MSASSKPRWAALLYLYRIFVVSLWHQIVPQLEGKLGVFFSMTYESIS